MLTTSRHQHLLWLAVLLLATALLILFAAVQQSMVWHLLAAVPTVMTWHGHATLPNIGGWHAAVPTVVGPYRGALPHVLGGRRGAARIGTPWQALLAMSHIGDPWHGLAAAVPPLANPSHALPTIVGWHG